MWATRLRPAGDTVVLSYEWADDWWHINQAVELTGDGPCTLTIIATDRAGHSGWLTATTQTQAQYVGQYGHRYTFPSAGSGQAASRRRTT